MDRVQVQEEALAAGDAAAVALLSISVHLEGVVNDSTRPSRPGVDSNIATGFEGLLPTLEDHVEGSGAVGGLPTLAIVVLVEHMTRLAEMDFMPEIDRLVPKATACLPSMVKRPSCQ